jgi:hypothetical protein
MRYVGIIERPAGRVRYVDASLPTSAEQEVMPFVPMRALVRQDRIKLAIV